ncbi:TetR family transcriptional regulator [Altererythrobacter aestiaquae]|uniref:TetR family transcriptional regulator n=2 Tax=Pontixanthobacter aestiaquae TaxID=1509367 RepID=A0A844Z3Y8_9SPHN|nr:TetR family transcriptional regulator [Pontixanthobacter aestiaquae]
MVKAASQMFFDVGYAATAIEQVAAKAGVSKVTVYNHFGDKRGLFIATVENECAKMAGHFSIEQAGTGDLKSRLLALGKAMTAFLARPEMTRFELRIAAETEHEPAIGRSFLDAGPRNMRAEFVVMLQSEVEAGRLQIDDLPLAAEQFVSMCKGFSDLERRFGAEADPERNRERIEGAVAVFLNAYGRSD